MEPMSTFVQQVDWLDKQAVLGAFLGEKESRIADVIARASKVRPAARVRAAYWELVTEGDLTPDAEGLVRKNGRAGDARTDA